MDKQNTNAIDTIQKIIFVQTYFFVKIISSNLI